MYTYHSLDSNYFDEINTPRKAYWLGYLFSDGSIGKNNAICLSCKSDDRYILEQFKSDIGSSAPITEYTNPERFIRDHLTSADKITRFVCYNKHMSERLIELGGGRKKDERVGFPVMPDNLVKDFIRGYFDGDGCIYKRTGKNCDHYYVSFCGWSDLLTHISRVISETLSIKPSKVYTSNNKSCYITWGGNTIVRKFFERIYKSEFSLKRKTDLFETCLSQNMDFKKRHLWASKTHFFRKENGDTLEVVNLMEFVENNPQFKYTSLIGLSKGRTKFHKGLYHVCRPIQNRLE